MKLNELDNVCVLLKEEKNTPSDTKLMSVSYDDVALGR